MLGVLYSNVANNASDMVNDSSGLAGTLSTDDRARSYAASSIHYGEHSKVFDHFYSSENAAAGTGVVGLGLAVAKLVIKRAGGRIAFDERFHQGARCVIDLPVSSGLICSS